MKTEQDTGSAGHNRRVEVLEPLRGLAALAVTWFHFTQYGPFAEPGTWLYRSGTYGWLGVEVFFVISGFVIPLSMDRSGYRLRMDAGRFLARRIVRLDPPYIAAIVLTLGLSFASTLVPGFGGRPIDVTALQLLSHLGYLNAFLGYNWLSPVFWTLAIEFQFYLLAAIGFGLITSSKSVVRLATLTALGVAAWLPLDDRFVLHFGPLFALGGAAFLFHTGRLRRNSLVAVMAALAFAAAVRNPLYGVVGLVTALIVAFVRVPRVHMLTWLGGVSYSLYLVHSAIGPRVLGLGAHLSEGPVAEWAITIAAVGLSLIVAWMMYLLVERHAQRWASAIRYRRAVVDESVQSHAFPT